MDGLLEYLPMNRLATLLLSLSLSILLVGCPARPRPLNQPQAILAEGTYTHEKSGMTFPLAVGDFRRGLVQRYDQEGLNVSAGYDLLGQKYKIAVTIYVYPAPSLISIGSPPEVVATARARLTKQEFEFRKREVMMAHPGGRLIKDTEIELPIGGTPRVGRMATFEYDTDFSGQRQTVRSHLCMFNFVGGRWALKYRISYPESLEVTREIDSVLQGVPSDVPKD